MNSESQACSGGSGSGGSGTGGSGSGSSSSINDNTPLWKYVRKVNQLEDGGGNMRSECNFCKQVYNGSYYRVKAHLLRISGLGIKGCSKVTSDNIAEMKRLVEEVELRLRNFVPKQVPMPKTTTNLSYDTSIESIGMQFFEPRIRKATSTRETTLEKSFNVAVQNQLHCEIARMFYSGGLSFNLARNPYYFCSYTCAANYNISGYIPPNYNMLRTNLLQQERTNIERLLEPIKSIWKEKGLNIVCDGWTDAQKRPLINFLGISESGPMFLKAVNCEGEYKDKYFIANMISKVIEEVGPQNVVQVITDIAPVCKAARMLIEAQFPLIFWTPCVAHTLNLALKNICAAKNTEANEVTFDEFSWITIIAEDVVCIKNFFLNHSMRLAIFNEFVNLKMLAVAETRFASVIVMLRRFKQIKRGLQNMVISDKWASYREDGVGKAQFVKDRILNDLWWDQINYILSFAESIYEMLRIADTDKPCLHLIYEMWDFMIEKVKVAIYRREGKKEDEESKR